MQTVIRLVVRGNCLLIIALPQDTAIQLGHSHLFHLLLESYPESTLRIVEVALFLASFKTQQATKSNSC